MNFYVEETLQQCGHFFHKIRRMRHAHTNAMIVLALRYKTIASQIAEEERKFLIQNGRQVGHNLVTMLLGRFFQSLQFARVFA